MTSEKLEQEEMKTVAFHSYKGGVGRTNAALNFAKALSIAGQKVVLLELDFDAPGIWLKPGTGDDPRKFSSGGYVDYLSYFYDHENLGENTNGLSNIKDTEAFVDRVKYLQNVAFNAGGEDNPFKIISAGADNDRYWWNLNSFWFNDFFSVARSDYAQFGKFHLHKHKSSFALEKRVLARLFSSEEDLKDEKGDIGAPETTDFLIIDCKSAREYACVPLYYWCDTAVLMFPNNYEGVSNLLRMWASVSQASNTVRGDADNAVSIIPIVCRIPPESLGKNAVLNDLVTNLNIKKLDRERLELGAKSVESKTQNNPLKETIFTIQEVSLATIDESLIGDLGDANFEDHSGNKLWYPEYMEDLAKIFSKITDGIKYPDGIFETDFESWLERLLPQNITEKRRDANFQKDQYERILNKDQNPNVLLRTESIRLIMNSLSSQMGGKRETTNKLNDKLFGVVEQIKQSEGNLDQNLFAEFNSILDDLQTSVRENEISVFWGAGRNVGISFANGFIAGDKIENEDNYKKCVEKWCHYDSTDAGFGQMHASFEKPGKKGRFIWKTCFLVSDKEEIEPTALKFLEGYIQENIQTMVQRDMDEGRLKRPLSVTVESMDNIEFDVGAIPVRDDTLSFSLVLADSVSVTENS